MNPKRPRSERFERGLKTRREVLGEDYVERSLANATDFNWGAQTLTTEWAWDEIWSRPGLDRRSRSLLNLGMLAALNRPHEFKVHVRGAIHNGLTVEELQEVLRQIGGYCGVPAAMDCFRLASEVLKDMGLAQ
jgi:4-carboxymuconolactone decarboxylase